MFRPAIVLAAFSICLGLAQARASAPQAQPLPLFDAHLHYNWEPTPYYPLEKVLALFREHGITGILATSRPNDGTRALVETRPSDIRVVPFIRPYIVHDDIQTWFDDPKIFQLVQAEFKRGYYQGIGEFHLSGKAAATEWVKRTVNFAVEHGLFLHAHADDEALEILFSHNPKARIIWAHTGFGTPPDKLADYLERYPGLTGELSYRFGISEGGVAGLVSEVPRPIPGRFGYLGRPAVGTLRGDHGRISSLARRVAARGRGANRFPQRRAAVRQDKFVLIENL